MNHGAQSDQNILFLDHMLNIMAFKGEPQEAIFKSLLDAAQGFDNSANSLMLILMNY